MEDIEKVLRYLEKEGIKPEINNEEDFLSSAKGKAVLKSIAMIKDITREVAAKLELNCNHDIEDICAFFEDNLPDKEKEKIEEQIFSCDSCFNLYKHLQVKFAELENHSPQWLKDQVVDKNENSGTAEFEKKSFFAKILFKLKTSLPVQASGVAVAAIAVLFIINQPIQEKMAKMEVATTAEQESAPMKAKKAAGNSGSMDKAPEKSTDIIIAAKPVIKAPAAENDFKDKSQKKVLPPSIISETGTISALSKKIITALKKPELNIPVSPANVAGPAEKKLTKEPIRRETKSNLPSKLDIMKNPPNTVLEKAKPVAGFAETKQITQAKQSEKPVMIANVPIEAARLKDQAKEAQQQENNKSDGILSSKAAGENKLKTTDADKDIGAASKTEMAKHVPEPRPNENSPNSVSQAAAPSIGYLDDKPGNKGIKAADEEKTVLKKESRANYAKAKAKTNIPVLVTINNIEFEKKGFVVIFKDQNGKRGEILGNTQLFSPGKYYNIRVSVNKEIAGNRAQAIIYEDSNNNSTFDTSDRPFFKNGLPIIKIIEIN